MDSCSTSQAEHGILWPAEILRLFRWSGHVLVESIPVVDLALESSNDKLARSVPALLANLIQLSNDAGWEIQGRRHSDDLLKLFPQQQLFEISQRVGFFHGSVGLGHSPRQLEIPGKVKAKRGSGTSALAPCGVTPKRSLYTHLTLP